MFVIELIYKADLDEIDANMAAHVAFLNKYYASGNFLVSGRKIPRDGGIILAAGKTRQQIQAIVEEDPFVARGLAIRERALVLPSLSHPDYLRVNRVCDAMLDTLHWSGGNTSLDALACGLPIVTLPGALMRGRQTAGMLDVMGAHDLIARSRDDYVRIAVKLATDAPWREEQCRRIVKGRDRLFDDRAPIDRLQAFLQDAALAEPRS